MGGREGKLQKHRLFLARAVLKVAQRLIDVEGGGEKVVGKRLERRAVAPIGELFVRRERADGVGKVAPPTLLKIETVIKAPGRRMGRWVGAQMPFPNEVGAVALRF